jgi:hypothetical protein
VLAVPGRVVRGGEVRQRVGGRKSLCQDRVHHGQGRQNPRLQRDTEQAVSANNQLFPDQTTLV